VTPAATTTTTTCFRFHLIGMLFGARRCVRRYPVPGPDMTFLDRRTFFVCTHRAGAVLPLAALVHLAEDEIDPAVDAIASACA
jgi:hypothetical protein